MPTTTIYRLGWYVSGYSILSLSSVSRWIHLNLLPSFRGKSFLLCIELVVWLIRILYRLVLVQIVSHFDVEWDSFLQRLQRFGSCTWRPNRVSESIGTAHALLAEGSYFKIWSRSSAHCHQFSGGLPISLCIRFPGKIPFVHLRRTLNRDGLRRVWPTPRVYLQCTAKSKSCWFAIKSIWYQHSRRTAKWRGPLPLNGNSGVLIRFWRLKRPNRSGYCPLATNGQITSLSNRVSAYWRAVPRSTTWSNSRWHPLWRTWSRRPCTSNRVLNRFSISLLIGNRHIIPLPIPSTPWSSTMRFVYNVISATKPLP